MFAVVVACLLVSITACGGDGTGANGASNGTVAKDASGGDDVGSATSQSDGGNTDGGGDTPAGESLAPPDNLTIAFPDGGTMTGSVSDTGYAYIYVEYPLDSYDDIVVFYDDWTSTDSRDWSGGDWSYDSQGTTVRSHVWDTSASMVGITECTAGGLPGDFNAVCLQINEYEE